MQFTKFNSNSSTPIIITIFLFYHSHLFSLFAPSIEVAYSISFILYSIAILYHNKNILSNVNLWLLISIVFVVISMLVGFGMDWSLRDIFADGARFLGPFIGYSAGLTVLRRLSYQKLIKIFYIFGVLMLFSYYISLTQKLTYVVQGGPVVEYAKNGLEVNHLYFFIFIIFLQKKIFGRVSAVLIIGYLIGYILSPIMLMSKARTISMVVSITLVFLFASKFKFKLVLIALSLILISTLTITSYSDVIFKRYNNFISVLETGQYHEDASTSFRIAEITNVTKTLIDTLPYSLLFGLGSGALYYETYAEIKGGVHADNFRSDGGVHHIFMAYLAYLFRYGYIGFMIIVLWIISIVYKLNMVRNIVPLDQFSNPIVLSVKFYILIMLISDIFVPVNIYGNMSFGYLLALTQIVAQKSNKEYKMY
jgi:hypothetical protein